MSFHSEPSAGRRDVPDAVYRVWRYRDRVELEAADLFGRLASEIRALRGPSDEVAALSQRAAEDEKRHSVLCRRILSHSPIPVETLEPNLGLSLGPKGLSREGGVLYAAVAMGCVTETLSAALLVNMQPKAGPALFRNTVHDILVDEIRHSRLGWAELARAASETEVSWLSAHIPGMIRDAIRSDIKPMVPKAEIDLSHWGVLPYSVARPLMEQTVNEVILPGLAKFGIYFEPFSLS